MSPHSWLGKYPKSQRPRNAVGKIVSCKTSLTLVCLVSVQSQTWETKFPSERQQHPLMNERVATDHHLVTYFLIYPSQRQLCMIMLIDEKICSECSSCL